MEDAMVAVASDGDKATADLLPSDWELMPLRRVSEEYGVLSVEGEVLAGHRMKMMVGSFPLTGTRSVRQTLVLFAMCCWARRILVVHISGAQWLDESAAQKCCDRLEGTGQCCMIQNLNCFGKPFPGS